MEHCYLLCGPEKAAKVILLTISKKALKKNSEKTVNTTAIMQVKLLLKRYWKYYSMELFFPTGVLSGISMQIKFPEKKTCNSLHNL